MKNKPFELFSHKRYDSACMFVAKKIVHIRDKEQCQKCLRNETHWVTLECSHNVNDWSDTRLSVFSDNMILLCTDCHRERRHKKVTEALERFESKFPGKLDELNERAISWISSGSITLTWREKRLNELIDEYNQISWKQLSIAELSTKKFR